jgi:hypothetical protein
MMHLVDTRAVRAMCPPCIARRSSQIAAFEVHPAQTGQLAEMGLLGEADQIATVFNQALRCGALFLCPRCGEASLQLEGAEQGYCVACLDWTVE